MKAIFRLIIDLPQQLGLHDEYIIDNLQTQISCRVTLPL